LWCVFHFRFLSYALDEMSSWEIFLLQCVFFPP
jgi:hypothetical protein